MEYLNSILVFFAGHPLAAFMLSLVFIVPCFYPVYSGKQKTLLLPCSITWLAFGLWSFYMLGQKLDLVEAVNPMVFALLLTVASFGVIIIIKGLVQGSAASCSID